MRFIIPIFLIGISILGFLYLVEPLYKEIGETRTLLASYESGLDRLTSLLKERDKLMTKKKSIDSVNLDKINKLLPTNIDNIRFIIEMQEIADVYGMTIKDIKFDDAKNIRQDSTPEAGVKPQERNEDYGILNFYFSVEGSYNNYLNFLKDLENNLRIIDVSSVQFTSSTTDSAKFSPDFYKYSFKIKTYWLKK